MAVVEQLLRAEKDGSISFGNYELPEKKKKENFEHNGNLLKVKTFKDITKLECNENFVYESVPGTAVMGLGKRRTSTKSMVMIIKRLTSMSMIRFITYFNMAFSR